MQSSSSQLFSDGRQVHLVQRLDRETSGFLLVGRTPPAAASLSAALADEEGQVNDLMEAENLHVDSTITYRAHLDSTLSDEDYSASDVIFTEQDGYCAVHTVAAPDAAARADAEQEFGAAVRQTRDEANQWRLQGVHQSVNKPRRRICRECHTSTC